MGSIRKKHVEVANIFIVPNYSEILNACGDSKFGNYSKGSNTQHQFIFEAVEPHEINFPFGVKVTYRAYSRDEVYEIVNGQNSKFEDMNIYSRLCQVDTFPKEKPATETSDAIPEGNYLPSI